MPYIGKERTGPQFWLNPTQLRRLQKRQLVSYCRTDRYWHVPDDMDSLELARAAIYDNFDDVRDND